MFNLIYFTPCGTLNLIIVQLGCKFQTFYLILKNHFKHYFKFLDWWGGGWLRLRMQTRESQLIGRDPQWQKEEEIIISVKCLIALGYYMEKFRPTLNRCLEKVVIIQQSKIESKLSSTVSTIKNRDLCKINILFKY